MNYSDSYAYDHGNSANNAKVVLFEMEDPENSTVHGREDGIRESCMKIPASHKFHCSYFQFTLILVVWPIVLFVFQGLVRGLLVEYKRREAAKMKGTLKHVAPDRSSDTSNRKFSEGSLFSERTILKAGSNEEELCSLDHRRISDYVAPAETKFPSKTRSAELNRVQVQHPDHEPVKNSSV